MAGATDGDLMSFNESTTYNYLDDAPAVVSFSVAL